MVDDPAERSLPAVVARAAARFGPRPFLLAVGEEPAMSFAEFDVLTERLAAGLARVVEPGEHVGLLVPTTNRAAAAVFAVAKAGAIPVLMPNQYRGEALERVIGTMLGGTRLIAPARWHPWVPGGLDLMDLGALPTGGGPAPWRTRPRTPDELAVILPTSGTTGAAKGVLLPHNHGLHYAECTIAMREMTLRDGVHAFAPLFHADGLYGNVLAALLVGARVALSWPVAVSRFWDTCRARDLTTFAYSGGLIAMLHAQPPRPDDADNPVRVASGAPSPPDTARAFERRFQLRLAEGYGSTEAGIPLIAPPDGSRVEEGSCGRAVTGYDVRLAPDGELLIRPHDSSFVMMGYVGDDEAYRCRVPGDGWFHTGDVLADIGGGHYAFRGRKDDVIRRRGEFITPVVIEQAALAHPGVVDAAAYGVPSPSGERGEHDVALAVVWAAGRVADPDALHEHLAGTLPPVAVPGVLHVMAEFPRSPGSDKVQKQQLPGAMVRQ